MMDKNTSQSRLGFIAFEEFVKMSFPTKKAPVTFEEFVNSKFYLDFSKLGRFLASRTLINPEGYTRYLLKNNIKSHLWTSEDVYQKFLKEYISREPVEKALERTFTTLNKWAAENNENWTDFFKKVTTFELVHYIRGGNISPWVLYLSEHAGDKMEEMSSEQGELIANVIDPVAWSVRFSNSPDDIEFVKNIVNQAGV